MRARALIGLLAGLAFASCRTQLQSATPKLSLSSSSVDFGAVPVLNTVSMPLTLTDIGEADLEVTSIAVSPAGGPFTLEGTPPTSIGGGGGSVTLTLTFTPPAQDTFGAALILVTDDPENPNLTVPLEGQGSTQGAISVSPNPVAFGQVGEGNTALQELTISSVGTAALQVNSIALGPGTDPAYQFASSTKTPVNIPNTAPNNSAAISLRFSPTAQTPASPAGSVVIGSTDPTQPSLSVPLTAQAVQAPIAVIADPGTVALGSLATLDGTGSYDPGGNTPLTYQWALTGKPISSAASLQNVQGPNPTILVDVAGAYDLSLNVTNSLGVQSVQPATATLTARPADDLYVEMIWDNQPVDMDLHFIGPSGTEGSTALDCNGNNENPTGFAATCPCGDHLTGPGPECAEDATPATGTYGVVVVYYSSHGVANPDTNVTVRIYEYGVVKGQLTQQLTASGQTWQVATVDWPSGTIHALGQVN